MSTKTTSQRTRGPAEKGLSPWEPRPTGTTISGTDSIRRCTLDYLLRLTCAVTIEAVLALVFWALLLLLGAKPLTSP